ncbi:MAG: hypothetical protein HY749_24365 [Gammaproteobacteria bacterium]|nr:hypothetical protein [Gammaproteobacteria bacterium]
MNTQHSDQRDKQQQQQRNDRNEKERGNPQQCSDDSRKAKEREEQARR